MKKEKRRKRSTTTTTTATTTITTGIEDEEERKEEAAEEKNFNCKNKQERNNDNAKHRTTLHLQGRLTPISYFEPYSLICESGNQSYGTIRWFHI